MRALAALFAIFFIAGCAHPARTPGLNDAEIPAWTGRLSLSVQSEPAQSFSAGFELQGNAGNGRLMLFSPLGSTLAQVSWTEQAALLESGQQRRSFDSLDALMQQLTGAPLPVGALFEWLGGRQADVPGWQANLSRVVPDGRLQALRLTPPPLAELRIVLDR